MADPTTAARKMFAKMGIAMPDGSFYIRNGAVGSSDLDNAIHAVGRGEQDGTSGNAIRLHIMKRAKALGLTSKIPDTWNPDGSLKHSTLADEVEEYLKHFGVPGMKWGHRKDGSKGSSHTAASDDSARAAKTQETIRQHGLSAVSNEDLQHLVSRQGLEQRHGQLNEAHASAGKKAVQDFLVQFGKQQASALASKGAAEGIKKIAELSKAKG